MRIRKPARLPSKTLILRPRGAFTGKYSAGFAIEASGPGGEATYDWCGARRHIHLLPQLSSYMTNLRLPVNLSADDVFVLTVTSKSTLILSLDLWNAGQPTGDLAVEEIDGETDIPTVCANPATDRDRKFEDVLMYGHYKVAASRRTPVGSIHALRGLPDGAVLYLDLHRLPGEATDRDLPITAAIGPMRRLCIIPAGRRTHSVTFWLQPEASGESWPLQLFSRNPFAWSAAAQRGYDSVFLPAFSFVEAAPDRAAPLPV